MVSPLNGINFIYDLLSGYQIKRVSDEFNKCFLVLNMVKNCFSSPCGLIERIAIRERSYPLHRSEYI